MADPAAGRALMTELLEGAEAMALLAEQEETFRAAVDAFRALDGESMQLLLSRHGLAERCEVVCRWLRSKECVLPCLEFCGPPRLEEEPPDVREFAEVVAKVTGDEELVELLAAAIEQRDADSRRVVPPATTPGGGGANLRRSAAVLDRRRTGV